MEHKYNQKLVPNARYLRKNMTPEERHLWYDFLRNYPVRFKRQMILGKYVADFYCAKAKLVVELDGNQHGWEGVDSYDRVRTDYMEKNFGLAVIRISNDDIWSDFQDVCKYIDNIVKMRADWGTE
ncbi:MAG: endonuclease domain-containing protein [Oscillospiraceae bacterium]|nr:endonuclease domain-containing protein [Oscillospiraceae bacterium]